MNKQSIGVLIVAVALAVIGMVSGIVTLSGRAAAPAGETTVASPDSGMGEGIQVHGHWKITVSDPDGSVVEVREFENALVVSGQNLLTDILTRQNTVGPWVIKLRNAFGNYPCWNGSSRSECWITEEANPSSLPNRFPGLVVSSVTQLSIVLSGSATALLGAPSGESSGQINTVTTWNKKCLSSELPGIDCGGDEVGFTSKDISPPVDVVAGQRIDVTVTISFN